MKNKKEKVTTIEGLARLINNQVVAKMVTKEEFNRRLDDVDERLIGIVNRPIPL